MPKGMGLVIVALLLTEWIGMSKIARAEMLRIKEQEYVLASRTLGAHSMHIIFKQILPNTIGPIITQMMFSIPTAIFTEAFLSFVGVGIMLPQCSIGSLIESGFNNITTLPYQILPPIIVLALQMLGFNFIGDGFPSCRFRISTSPLGPTLAWFTPSVASTSTSSAARPSPS